MRCDEFEQSWDGGPSADASAHVAACDCCAAAVVDRSLTEASLPTPPRGFAHLTALRATAAAAAAPAQAPPQRGFVVALAWGVGLLVAALGLRLLETQTSASVSMAASAGVLVVLEAAAMSAAIFLRRQAPPLQRHS